ncbi:MAG: hypothetical protein L0I80_01585 [Brevibacterium sp.]|uniref:hypothetical protein n=1 Tax=Brevibacterium sp. TaxID=1701 RepID=UPI002648541D|nr:hypothetical protein [Brevibacterium sp.]MDN5806707.1 hypothetical protein [Brevibacterium sp.]MDN5832490.1 hypothetical protein [Brevibacterium sp.]MDN5875156.1 hypothetical protein [Brevibacterium sp.]MDN5908271.1 hypothetical protein [Brevibacterium sp.]MDN6122550.1 hypothetical protein [Brevibacterium sp.]
MDALLLIDTDDASYTSDENAEILVDIVGRTRAVGGVLIFASTKDELVDVDDEELSIFVPDEEDLVLRSESPDVFDGISDLAPGLHDMAIDRIVIAGGDITSGDADGAEDVPGSVRASAMAALVCNFDVIVLSDAVIDPDGQPVTWLSGAEDAGAMVKKTADTWLRM